MSLDKEIDFLKNFFGKCDQIRRKLRIWSHLLKKSLTENFIFCANVRDWPATFLNTNSTGKEPPPGNKLILLLLFQYLKKTSKTNNSLQTNHFLKLYFSYLFFPAGRQRNSGWLGLAFWELMWLHNDIFQKKCISIWKLALPNIHFKAMGRLTECKNAAL